MSGLSPSDVVNVTVNFTAQVIPLRNFGALMIIGPTEGVIDTSERIRQYSTITQVVNDFGTTAPEYLAANLFFAQSPQPAILYIGRWAKTATHAWLHGAVLSATQQNISNFTGISSGSMGITIDGTLRTLTALNFSSQTNLNGVAGVVNTALGVNGTCTWNASLGRFDIRGTATGASGTITYAVIGGAGTDVTAPLGLSQAAGASTPVPGIVAETPLACVTVLAAVSSNWYGCMFAPTAPGDIVNGSYTAVAGFIEAASPSRVFGCVTQESHAIDPTQSDDLASLLQALGYNRTFVQYSSSSNYAIASAYARAFTVDFTANNSTITLKFKLEPGVVAETLNETQANTLKLKNCNVFVNYNNAIAIFQEGVMSGGVYCDERFGLDWLQNDVQTDVFNLLYASPTKVPQTDPGVHQIVTAVEAALGDALNNGLVAPGVWNAPGFGQISQGQFLPKGFYTFMPPIATQSIPDRAARKAPTCQVAVKLAGAVHYANVILNVNR